MVRKCTETAQQKVNPVSIASLVLHASRVSLPFVLAP
jgi:hypothetical protein